MAEGGHKGKAKPDAKGAIAQGAEPKEGEELDLFEKALGKVEEDAPTRAAPMRRSEERASLFAQVTAQYRKREQGLAP